MKPHTKATTLHAKPSANFADKLAATQAQLPAMDPAQLRRCNIEVLTF
jgi:hypothetical protein